MKSAYHAFGGLFWVVANAPSLQLGVAVSGVLMLGALILKAPPVELVVLLVTCGGLLAVETLNTSIELLADHLHPGQHPAIARVKDTAAGATAVMELVLAAVVLLLLGPRLWHLIGR